MEGRVLRSRKAAPQPAAKRKFDDIKKPQPGVTTIKSAPKRGGPKKLKPSSSFEPEAKQDRSVHEFEATTIDGQVKSLQDYKGKVCIILNVASRCGHTAANYKQLVELYDKYKEKGLRILAFPCNQFGKQEPGDHDKIKEFVKKRNVKFDMFAKIDVKGAEAEPLWEYLNSVCPGPKPDIEWNFVKFLIDKEGLVVKRYKPSAKALPDLEKDLESVW